MDEVCSLFASMCVDVNGYPMIGSRFLYKWEEYDCEITFLPLITSSALPNNVFLP